LQAAIVFVLPNFLEGYEADKKIGRICLNLQSLRRRMRKLAGWEQASFNIRSNT
jgi:hypothetical protein